MAATAVTIYSGDGYNRGSVFTASAPPTKDNDGIASPAHQRGDKIVDTVGGGVYECVSNATGAARWVKTSFTGQPAGAAISAAASTANVSLVTFQLTDAEGQNLSGVFNMDIWLSDAATGAGLTATTASGAVAANTGTDLVAMVAKKAIHVQTDATGKYILSITDTAKTLFYPCVQIPGQGNVVVGAQLTTPSYG